MTDTYRPSGRFNILRMALFLPFAVALALLVGYAVMRLFDFGWYILGLVPLVAGFLVAGGALLLVAGGHCRNRLVGAAAGLALGLLMHASYYQFHMAHVFGWDKVGRVDLLPDWVHFRIQTDETKKVGAGNNAGRANRRNREDMVFKWAFFGLDVLCAAVPAAAVGWSRSGRPFSEAHKRWLGSQKRPVERDAGRALAAALLDGDPADAVGLFEPPPAKPDLQTELTVDYLEHEPDSPVYLTVAEVRNPNEPQKQKVYWKHWRKRLTPEAAAVLARELTLPNAAFAPPADDGHLRPGDKASDRPAGLVTPLTDQDRGQILSRGFIGRAIFVQLSPLFLGVGVAGLLGYTAYAHRDEWGAAELIGCGAGALGALVVMCVYLLRHEHYLPAVMHRNRALAVIGRRADAVVDAADADARFVEIVPRANWNKMMTTNASDSGLLALDLRRRAVLFEGDNERWVLPAESVVSAELAEFCDNHMEKNPYSTFWAVVLTANVGGRVWEAPVVPRPLRFAKWTGPERKVEAERLRADIAAALGLADDQD